MNGPIYYLDIETLRYIKSLAEESIDNITSSGENIEETNSIILENFINSTKSITYKKKEPEPKYLYIMKDTSTGYHKIGISKNPQYREKTLQSEKPTIEIVWVSDSTTIKARDIEKALHSYFEHRRTRGEWYNLSSHQIESIKNNYNTWKD